MLGYYLISGIMMLVGMWVSSRLKGKMVEYSQMSLLSGMTGKDVAEKMLRDNGIYDVQVISTPGFLSDHYDPTNKTVNLSSDVYNGTHVAAAAVAAHECGHAVQHATQYNMLQMRSRLVPVLQISSNLAQWVILIGLGMLFGRSNPTILLIGILLFAVSTVFSLITLPVEYDASNRGLAWLNRSGIAQGKELEAATDGLKWAARTYVVAAIASVANLLYYIMLFMNMNRRDD